MDEAQPVEEWSAERRRELRRAVEVRRRRQAHVGRVAVAALIAIVGAGVLLRWPPEWWIPAVGIVALAGFVFRLVHWRCPACNEGLPSRGSGRACPGCGLPLDWN